MTDRPRRHGRVAVPLTTATVTATATAAVAWAAATPPAASATPSPLPVVADRTTAATYSASLHLVRAQRTLAEVRADLVQLMQVRLPRAKVDHALVAVAPGLPPAQVQIPAASPVVVPAAPAPAPPPPAHTTTGASGGTRP